MIQTVLFASVAHCLFVAHSLILQREPPLVIPTISRLNDRQLQQNTELSNISQL